MPWVEEKVPQRIPSTANPLHRYRFSVPRGSHAVRGVRVEISQNGVLNMTTPDHKSYAFCDDKGEGFPYEKLDATLAKYCIYERPSNIPTEFREPTQIVE